MLAFFRRALGSWVVVALLAMVVAAFVITGVNTPGGLGGSAPSANSVASIDGKQIASSDVAQRVQTQYEQFRRQQPDLTQPQFLQLAGGINMIVDQYLSARLLEVWGAKHGLVAGDKQVDGEIASIPAFQGLNGKFDEQRMRQALAQQRVSLESLRDGVRGDLIRRALVVPIGAAAMPPAGVVLPYAKLLAAKREGEIGIVPLKPQDAAQPTPAEIDAWYKGHAGRYSVPERRVIRYAPVSLDAMQVPTPDDAVVEAQYKADAAKYAASEKRTLKQVVLPDQAAASALAAKVAGGAAFDTAAAAAGFDAASITLGQLTKADYAAASSPAIADAAFALKQGGTTAPVKSPLGWHVVHVDAIDTIPARSLAEVRGEILGALLKKARSEALGKAIEKIDNQIGDGARFDEIVRANGLTATTSPPLAADGKAPADPAFQPDATLTALLKPAFQAAPEDAPTLETLGADGNSAVLSVSRIDAPSALPLAQVRDRVVADITLSRAVDAAKATAQAIVAKVNGGKPLAAALSEAGLPAPQPISVSNIELRGQQVPPPVRVLFTLAPGKSGLALGPKGLFVVHLLRIADPAPQVVPMVAGQLRAELGRSVGDEYAEQFANAARRDLTIRKNPAAIDALGRQLSGQAPAASQQ